MAGPSDDDTLRLADGRRLGWSSYGDPAGATVVAVHGSPDSRVIWALASEAAARHGLRLIAPDRPGYRLSDPRPRASVLDWCDDVVHLADHLAIGRFAVLAISGGGMWAAGCAWKLASRVTGLGLLCVIGPLDAPGAKDGMNRLVRVTYGLARTAPWLLTPIVRGLCRTATRNPEKAAARIERTRPDEDVEVVCRPEVRRVLMQNIANQFRDPDTVVHEFRLATQPWPVPLHEIDVPAHIWQGGRDTVHTPGMARHLAARIPSAELTLEPGFATFTFFDHLDPVMDTLGRWTDRETA